MNNSFVSGLKEYREIIDDYINGQKLMNIITVNNKFEHMKKYLTAFQKFSMCGKRIRAYLVKLGYEMCGGENIDDIILPSLSYEMFQSGVLIQDDVIDKSEIRRNRPTMHVLLGNNHSAVSKSICMGDMGLLIAIDMILLSPFDPIIIEKAVKHQSKVFQYTVCGELKDIELSNCSYYNLEDVIEMYRLKTSWYTITGPLQLGAILINADEKMLGEIEEIGNDMGIAFQIKDDILGVFGEEKIVGKSILSDMLEGKQTVLTKHFIENANESQIEKFNSIYGNNESNEQDLECLKEMFTETKSYDFAKTLCTNYAENIKNKILKLDIKEKYKDILSDLCYYLCERNL